MIKKPCLPIRTSVLLTAVAFTPVAFADFLSDSKAQLQLKNFYFSRDFRDGFPSQSRRAEWAQGFQLNLKSGFTDGPVGFGLDAVGMLGVKLDSSPARAGTGILPRGEHGASDDYAKLLVTGKAKFQETEVRVGGLSPALPLLLSNNTRLFDQYFNGAQITSKDFKNATLHFGRVDRTKLRDSSSFDALTTTEHAETSDGYTYGGIDYKLTPTLQLSAHASELEDFYTRQFLGLTYSLPAGPGRAFTDLRYFRARPVGQEKVGNIDNDVVSTNFGYQLGAHTLSGGYQKVSGAAAYAYVGGTGTYLFSEQTTSTFSAKNERVWHARYDYDFAALGIPGLKMNIRYVKGDQVDPEELTSRKGRLLRAEGREGSEWERTTDITYVIQSGPLKNFGMRWRNGTNRSSYADSADENRVILTYGIDF
jgi:hypothetical protein